MKMLALIMILACSSVFAGGLSFEGIFKGIHPLTNKEVVADFESEGEYGNYKHILTLDERTKLKMNLKGDVFNPVERTLKLLTQTGDHQYGKVVTSAECQNVEHFLIILNSGLQIKMSK